jgi:outer membrane protein OmpA-like peptidoglycan-associated protein
MKRVCLVLALFVLAGCQQPPTAVAPPPPLPATPSVPLEPVPPPSVESAGPLKQAAVATYMDAQEADLRDFLRGQPVAVSRRGNTLVLDVTSDRIFDKAAISAWGNAFLTSLFEVLGHYDHTTVAVDAADAALSEPHAKAIAATLIRFGIAPARFTRGPRGRPERPHRDQDHARAPWLITG